MNGLRSNSQQHSDRSSLDALNRTIEGLEARIEDLLGAKPARPVHESAPARAETERNANAARSASKTRFDPVNEIRQRQQALDARWERQQTETPRGTDLAAERDLDRRYSERDYRASTAIPPARPRPTARYERTAPPEPSRSAPDQGDAALREVAEALVSLRQELKHEISQGVAREMQGVRSELRNIRTFAESQDFAEDIREDVARLAASIDRMGETTSPDIEALRGEFEELRSLMDQVARQDSMHRMEQRFNSVDDRLSGLDTAPLQDEILTLAYRLDDIKSQLGSMSGGNATVRALEDKLLTIASAVEQIGKHVQPSDQAYNEHFSGLDQRLDEISRAIAAAGNRPAPSFDAALADRLENRLQALSSQMDALNELTAAKDKPSEALGLRLDALTSRIEEMSTERSVAQLGERLDQLSLLLERSQRPSSQPELTRFLIDISRKIDELGSGAVNDRLAERLEKIARRIEQIEAQPASAKGPSYDTAFKRLEDRLSDIAAKLDETQIPVAPAIAGMPPELNDRMSAIEEYMASSDEYIIEAARQAAEAVLDAHTRNNLAQTANSGDIAILTELANDLRKLEGLSRNTEERTHRTFEALHETLVQIAGRLDNLDSRGSSRPATAAPVDADRDWADYDGNARMPAAAFPEEGLIAQDEHAGFEHKADVDTDTLVPPEAQKPAVQEKRGLLAGLTRRFKSSAAKTDDTPQEQVSARTHIDPAPALDPVDVLQADIETELLEPGSGAPDIKKILERVRASQAAAARSGATESDNRADFIAAARRAAQAAAQESVPEKSQASRSLRNKAAVEKQGFALSRYRRPLLLGIGAILLAMMAMPAIKSFVGGDTTPATIATEPATAEPTSAPATSAPPTTPVEAQPASSQPAVTEPSDLTIDEKAKSAAERMQVDADKKGHLIDTRTIGGAPLPQDTLALNAAALSQGTDIAEQLQPVTPNIAVQQDTLRGAETIAVPAGIAPPSLADAAAKGDRLALFEIGARFTDGRGVAADRTEAAKWYKLAADRGLAPAQYRLGNMYEKANGVERNLSEAKRYYQMAAEQGNAGAMHNLAVLLASDAAGAPDFKAAGDWFIKASNLGVRDSQFNLAILYARGSGVQQSLEESYKWFAIAARDGDADAGQKRDDVAKAMRPEQLASAKARLDAWQVTPLNDEANSVNPPAEWVGGEEVKTSSVDMEKAIRNIQAILNNNGFKAGEPDGKLGRNTVMAIKDFQKSVGQTPDGRITDELVTALLARNK